MEIFFMILCILGVIASIFKCLEETENHKPGSALIWGLLIILNIAGTISWGSMINKKPVDKTYQYQTIVTKTLITTNDTVILKSDTTHTYTE
jgi:hypothetical protein